MNKNILLPLHHNHGNSFSMKKYDIYFCYSRKDSSIVQVFADRLNKEGLTLFYDVNNLATGDIFADIITDAIRNCKVFLYFHSENTVQSNWIVKEITFALDYGCKIVPINIGNHRSDDSSIRRLLFNRHWLEFDSHALDGEEQFEKVIYNILRSGLFSNFPESSIGGIQQPVSISPIMPQEDEREQASPISPTKSSGGKRVLWIFFFIALVSVVGGWLINMFSGIDEVTNLGSSEEIITTTSPKLLQPSDVLYCWLLILGVLSVLIIIIVYYKMSRPYIIRLHNTERKHRVKVCVDGKNETEIAPSDVVQIKRRKGEYVLSIQIENDDDKFVCINQKFDKVHHNEIIPIVFSQIKKVVADDEVVNKLDFIKYRCFIGGSTAITNERNATRAVLSILYNQYEKYNFFITSYTFEDFRNKHKIDGHQYEYDEFIREKADCTIFIICKHVGEKTLNEYKLAVETYESTKEKRPAIFVYNYISEIKDKDGNLVTEDESVAKFHKLVDSKRAYWRDYKDIDMLMLLIKDDVSAELADVLEMRPQLRKKNAYF